MNIIPTTFEGLFIVEPKIFSDNRGFFTETYHKAKYQESGIPQIFIQDNLSSSVQNTLRGLHYQIKKPQAKIVQVIVGAIFDVAVDIRVGSPTFGKWAGVHLSEKNMRQLFIPEGFAHGFCVLSETALVTYKCSDFYHPEDEGGIIWSDPDIGIDWPAENPIISEKDMHYPRLSELSPGQLPFPKTSREK
ncbi:dTDP-4-dehydrorhamnose 3,5-epimerase [Thermodesulfobacteriota bacterium]